MVTSGHEKCLDDCYVEINMEETGRRAAKFVLNFASNLPHFNDLFLDDRVLMSQSCKNNFELILNFFSVSNKK